MNEKIKNIIRWISAPIVFAVVLGGVFWAFQETVVMVLKQMAAEMKFGPATRGYVFLGAFAAQMLAGGLMASMAAKWIAPSGKGMVFAAAIICALIIGFILYSGWVPLIYKPLF